MDEKEEAELIRAYMRREAWKQRQKEQAEAFRLQRIRETQARARHRRFWKSAQPSRPAHEQQTDMPTLISGIGTVISNLGSKGKKAVTENMGDIIVATAMYITSLMAFVLRDTSMSPPLDTSMLLYLLSPSFLFSIVFASAVTVIPIYSSIFIIVPLARAIVSLLPEDDDSIEEVRLSVNEELDLILSGVVLFALVLFSPSARGTITSVMLIIMMGLFLGNIKIFTTSPPPHPASKLRISNLFIALAQIPKETIGLISAMGLALSMIAGFGFSWINHVWLTQEQVVFQQEEKFECVSHGVVLSETDSYLTLLNTTANKLQMIANDEIIARDITDPKPVWEWKTTCTRL